MGTSTTHRIEINLPKDEVDARVVVEVSGLLKEDFAEERVLFIVRSWLDRSKVVLPVTATFRYLGFWSSVSR